MRISGVRGRHSMWVNCGEFPGFNPVRISGVRGPICRYIVVGKTCQFQSGADFWGPGTRRKRGGGRLDWFQSGADFWGPGTRAVNSGLARGDSAGFNPVRISGVRGQPPGL